MVGVYKELTANQFEAAFCMLHAAIVRCPAEMWDAPVGNYLFCQVAFHALFYADYYLGPNEAAFREQAFHRDHQAFFGDYEEFEDRPPAARYEADAVAEYLAHCRQKARAVIAAETAESLSGPTGFARRNVTRAELHVYNMRHIQHHAAQLSLRLRLDAGVEVPWVASGWRD